MGNDNGRPDEQPAHPVVLAPFRAAISPVTNAQYAVYRARTGAEPPPFLEDGRFSDSAQPVVGINWFDAVAYCEWLRAEARIPCRLPTEAEREFAALGGLPGGDWPWPGLSHPLADAFNAFDRPHSPGPGCANGYGLFCMAENVHEWCSDWYSASYYTAAPVECPPGPAAGKRRSSRGGSWRHREKFTRINARSSLDPGVRYSDFCFRVYAD